MTDVGEGVSLLRRALNGLRGVFSRPESLSPRGRRLSVLAHRGEGYRAPPNTVEACRVAMADGAHGVEVDVCVTADGVGVLWHDRDPAHWIAVVRRLGLEGFPYVPCMPHTSSPEHRPVSRLGSADFFENYGIAPRSALGFGAEDGARVTVPDRLSAFVKWAVADVRVRVIALDLKLASAETHRVGPFAEELAALSARYPRLRQKRLYVLTTQAEVFRCLSAELARRPALHFVRLTADFESSGVVEAALRLGARHVSIGTTLARMWSAVRYDIVEAVAARNRGLLETVGVWTLNDEGTLREALGLGVDFVLTDETRLAVQVSRQRPGRAGAPR